MHESKIMIVDDELIMRKSLEGWLERDGHYVETAASGEEALKKLKQQRFDILLVDITSLRSEAAVHRCIDQSVSELHIFSDSDRIVNRRHEERSSG